jgi:hypothetical protein
MIGITSKTFNIIVKQQKHNYKSESLKKIHELLLKVEKDQKQDKPPNALPTPSKV